MILENKDFPPNYKLTKFCFNNKPFFVELFFIILKQEYKIFSKIYCRFKIMFDWVFVDVKLVITFLVQYHSVL